MVRFGLSVALSLAFFPTSIFASPKKNCKPFNSELFKSSSPVAKRLAFDDNSGSERGDSQSVQPLPSLEEVLFHPEDTLGSEGDESQMASFQPKRIKIESEDPGESEEIDISDLDFEFEADFIPSTPHKKAQTQKKVPVSPTALNSPEKALNKQLFGVRTRVAKSFESERKGKSGTSIINSPSKLEKAFEGFASNHFTHQGVFQGVPYYLDMRLFDPQQVVLNVRELETKIETNHERMLRGCAPHSYKTSKVIEQYLNEPVMVGNPNYPWGVDYYNHLNKQQNKHRMDIHHLLKTMKGGVTPMPSHIHHGTDFGVVVKDGKILAYGLSRKEARPYLKTGASYFSDCLHPNFGASKIDRKAFDQWRKDFWKYVAKLISDEKENGIYKPFSKTVPKIDLFSVNLNKN